MVLAALQCDVGIGPAHSEADLSFLSSLGILRDDPAPKLQNAADGEAWEGIGVQFSGLNVEGNILKANHGLFTVKLNGPLPVETEQLMSFKMHATGGVTTRVRVVFCERQIVGDSDYLALVA
jgi:hypothetical protein